MPGWLTWLRVRKLHLNMCFCVRCVVLSLVAKLSWCVRSMQVLWRENTFVPRHTSIPLALFRISQALRHDCKTVCEGIPLLSSFSKREKMGFNKRQVPLRR